MVGGYLMEDDEECREMCEGVGMTLAVIGYAAELDPRIDNDESALKILRGGLSACQQMLNTGKWKATNAVSIDMALDAAELLNKEVRPEFINKAWKILSNTGTTSA